MDVLQDKQKRVSIRQGSDYARHGVHDGSARAVFGFFQIVGVARREFWQQACQGREPGGAQQIKKLLILRESDLLAIVDDDGGTKKSKK